MRSGEEELDLFRFSLDAFSDFSFSSSLVFTGFEEELVSFGPIGNKQISNVRK